MLSPFAFQKTISNSCPGASGASATHLKSVATLLLWLSPGWVICAEVGPPVVMSATTGAAAVAGARVGVVVGVDVGRGVEVGIGVLVGMGVLVGRALVLVGVGKFSKVPTTPAIPTLSELIVSVFDAVLVNDTV